MNGRIRVGFIADGLVPSMSNCFSRRTIRPLFAGWPSGSSGFKTRFSWVSDRVNREKTDLWYELFRPRRRYHAVVFLKSMNAASINLARHLSKKGCRPVFDLNIDYLTPAAGTFYYDGMAPTATQRDEALAMVNTSDAVIADSRWLEKVARRYAARVCWVPDSIPNEFIQNGSNWRPSDSEPLPLLWCGEAVKLFDLLRIEPVLRSMKKRLKLRIITNSLDALKRIYEPWRSRLRRMLRDIDCEILPFKGLKQLMEVYDRGGVFVSPRFLNNSYNMGHTEWKITLAMARGRVALCSAQPSYQDVADRAGSAGIRICPDLETWQTRLEEVFCGNLDWELEQSAASTVVRNYYAASVVALAHRTFMHEVLAAA